MLTTFIWHTIVNMFWVNVNVEAIVSKENSHNLHHKSVVEINYLFNIAVPTQPSQLLLMIFFIHHRTLKSYCFLRTKIHMPSAKLNATFTNFVSFLPPRLKFTPKTKQKNIMQAELSHEKQDTHQLLQPHILLPQRRFLYRLYHLLAVNTLSLQFQEPSLLFYTIRLVKCLGQALRKCR